MRKRFLAFALAATLAAGCLGASVPGMAGQGTAAAGSIQQEAGTEREAEETGEIQEKPCIEAAGAETETAEMETAGTEAGKADAVRETEAEETGKGPGTAAEETGEGTENGTEITEKETEEEPEGGTEAGKQPGTAGPEKGTEPERGFSQWQAVGDAGMFSAALKAAPKAAGQEDDDRGYCSHLNSYCPAYCVEAKSGQVDPKKIFDWAYNAYIHVRPVSTATYGALSLKNGQWGSGSALTAAQTTGIGPFSGKLPAYKFFCSEAQYQNSPNKAYAVYRNAVGVLDRTTCTIKYYDLRLTLAGFQKAFKSTDGEQKRKEHGTEAYFLWDPIRPGIYTRQLNYADVRIEVLEPGTDTVTSTAIKGFTLVKDLDQFQGISWAGSGPYYETYYSGVGEIRVANVGTAAAPRYYAHSTTSADLTGDTDTRTWLGLGFHNGMSVTFVQAQGKYSQDGHNALATDLGAQPEVPVLPPAVTLQKYVGLNADPNNGLGSTKEAFLPNYCGDTYYYRVVLGANNGDFRSLVVSDTFPEWLGVTGIKVYRQSGSSWVLDTSGFPNVSAKVNSAYGSKKTIELPSAVNLVKGNTYCIEYEVKAAPAPEFQNLSSRVSTTDVHYWWTNTASANYTYGLQSSVVDGSPVTSNAVYTYMPKPPAVSLDKYISLSGDINDGLGSAASVNLPGFGNNGYYYRLVATFSDTNYTSTTISDIFPEWEYISEVKVYKRSGDSWNLTAEGVSTEISSKGSGKVKTTEISINKSSVKGATYCIEYKVGNVIPKNFLTYEHQPSKNNQYYYWDNFAELSYSYPTSGGTLEGTPITSNTVEVRLPIAPEMSLEKYVSADADINNGLGSKTCYLPNFCGDTYYYRVVAKFDTADYRSATISDTFHEWDGIVGINVYKKSGENWSPTTTGVSVPQPDSSYGSEKTVEVSIDGANARGNTYCIEYKVVVISKEGFSDLLKFPYDIGKWYSWSNEAILTYSCMSLGEIRKSSVDSEMVFTYMPVPVKLSFEKYVSLNSDINESLGSDEVYLPNCGGDIYYYRILVSFDDAYQYRDAIVRDTFPGWVTLKETKVYKNVNGVWGEAPASEAFVSKVNKDMVNFRADNIVGTYCIEYTVQVASADFSERDISIDKGLYCWDNVAALSFWYKHSGNPDYTKTNLTTNKVTTFMPMQPVASLEKYVSSKSNPNTGLGDISSVYLPNYCGDIYYYRVVASFNDVNYSNATISDTFKKWEMVAGIKVYKSYGDNWVLTSEGVSVPQPDSSYGSEKTVEVSIDGASARGDTFCIEYMIKIPPVKEFESLSSRPGYSGTYYLWSNKADLSYTYDLSYDFMGSSSGSGTKTSNTVKVNMKTLEVYVYKRDEKTDLLIEGAKLSILNSDGKVVSSFTTSANGNKVGRLISGTYTLREDKAPAGYKRADPITFTLTADEMVQEVTMYDAPLETCTVTVRKRIKASDIVWAHGSPSFLFDLMGTEEDGTEHSYAGSVTFTADMPVDVKGMLEGTYVFPNVPIGEYKVSERDAAPYTSAASVTGCSDWGTSVSGSMEPGQDYQKVSVTINTTGEPDRNPVVTFTNDKQAWDDYRHTDLKVNRIPVER